MLQPIRHGSAVLVDNNTFQRKLLRTVLRSSGFIRVNEFENVEIGLDEASRLFPDFIFIDYETAQGSELFRSRENIRNKMLGANTRMFFLMQDPTQQRVAKAVEFGAHWVISRPFSPKSLNQRLRAILDPGYAMAIQPTLQHPTNTGPQSEQRHSDEENMVELAEHMQNFLSHSQDYHDQLAPTRTAVRANIRDRIHKLEQGLHGKNPIESPAQDNSDESIHLI